jgi:hypothetical protein
MEDLRATPPRGRVGYRGALATKSCRQRRIGYLLRNPNGSSVSDIADLPFRFYPGN